MEYILAGLATLLLGMLSAIAGGGVGVLIPLLIMLGFDIKVAIASSKYGAVAMNLATLRKFRTQAGLIQKKVAIRTAIISAVASVIGVIVSLKVSSEILEQLVALIVIAVVLATIFSRQIGKESRETSKHTKTAGYVAYTSIIFMNSGLGAGLGILNTYAFMGFLGLSAIQASATRRVGSLVSTVISAGIFTWNGLVDWKLAIALAIGFSIGGTIGSHLAINGGNKLVRKALLLASSVLAISILLT